MVRGMLVEGRWVKDSDERDSEGRFNRKPSIFRNWVKADGSSDFVMEKGRYHLYLSLACPWSHRVLIMLKLKGLEQTISYSILDPEKTENGWTFSNEPGCIIDTIENSKYLWEIYNKSTYNYTGLVTVPVLYDRKIKTIVNNESLEIMRMLDTEFDIFTQNKVSYYPEELRSEIDSTIESLYKSVNNAVYRAGFASKQTAYEEAVTDIFQELNHWEKVLENQRYLCGNVLTEADWSFFVTLFRMDLVYNGLFKCNIKHITDYPNLWNYLKELYQYPGVKETCNIDHIKRHYYKSLKALNPSQIVPAGPVLNYDENHNRNMLKSSLSY